MADEIRPKEKFQVEVRESGGRPMTYTLAVVDEGLLGLTRFATPDLRKGFYSREALGVSTWDLFDLVAEAYGAEMARILALGGDEGAESKDKAKQPRRFPPVVLFEGPFELKAGGSGVHELIMPQYFGAVRVMVVAGRDGAFGSAEKSVPVRRDLMTLATLPRVVRPGEDVVMPISVFVTKPGLKEVTVGVETNGLFEVVGERSKTVAFARPGDDIVSFASRRPGGIGQGEVRFRATGGSERVEDAIAVPVLASNALITQTTRLEIKPGQDASSQASFRSASRTRTRSPSKRRPCRRSTSRSGSITSSSIPTAASSRRSRRPCPSSTSRAWSSSTSGRSARSRRHVKAAIQKMTGLPDDERRLLVLAGQPRGPRVDDRLRRLLPARGGAPRLSRPPGHARRLAGEPEDAVQRLRHGRRAGPADPGLPAVRAGPGPRPGPRGHEPAPGERRPSRVWPGSCWPRPST